MTWAVGDFGAAETPWLARPRGGTGPVLRLFCIPYAGGSAGVFRAWSDGLPAEIEICAVQLPGRGTRIGEPPFTRLRPLVRTLAGVVEPWLDRPYALFGHSMGALVAYELALQLRRNGARQPAHVMVSGHRAPHLPDGDPPIHDLDEPAFVQEVRRLDGLPAEVLEDAELRQLILPALRADFELCESYAHADEEPLDSPLLVLGGRDDGKVDAEHLAAWRPYTRGRFELRMLAGGHFFIENGRPRVLALVRHALDPLLPRPTDRTVL